MKGRKGWHYHKFTTDEGRTVRVCVTCGAKQVKVSGKWAPAP